MDERASGLILRLRPLTETSLIVGWLTPDCGRIATVAKGARRPKSPFRGKLDLFYEADFSFRRSRRSELHTLNEVVLRDPHPALRRELAYLQQASYCAALIEQTTESDTPLVEIHALMAGFLRAETQHPPSPLAVLAFELKLLQELGQSPDLDESRLSPGARQIMEHATTLDWTALACLKPSPAQHGEIQQFLHGFMIYHLGRLPKGRSGALNLAEG